MPNQPVEGREKDTVACDIDNSRAAARDQTSPVESGKDTICRTDTTPARYILARKVPFYTQNKHSSPHQPLQHHTWCLIKTEKDQYKYELLSECQTNRKAGKFRYHDVDSGKGLHPHADLAWLIELRSKGQWSTSVYDVKAKVHLRERNHCTVLLSAKGYGRDVLKKVRRDFDYAPNELVRLSLSTFRKARNG